MLKEKEPLLTGDTPSGRLHLGHLTGSLENRVHLQNYYDCYFMIANTHAFTLKTVKPEIIKENTIEMVLDYLSVGIDTNKSKVFVESDIPSIYELATWISMAVPLSKLIRNPTIKEEIRDKKIGSAFSTGFLWYPILQVADILSFRPQIVPIGEDQIPHIELARDVARSFNNTYCTGSTNMFFEDIEYRVGRQGRLVGIGAPSQSGKLLKMSKSLGNAIYLSDSPDVIKKKIMSMYTDPKRIRSTDPGRVENNPLWIFHDVFNKDKSWVREAKQKYQNGKIGDVVCKKQLIDSLIDLLEPIQKKRSEYEKDIHQVKEILKAGGRLANEIAEDTLYKVKDLICQLY